ncbi:MAG: hypothetical protein CMJ64_28515 [Planctomycetaceae bacterium]|nr:hypothetical protein [Planctomycetaceae bacterium]
MKSVGRQRLALDWLAAVSRFTVEVCGLLLLLFAVDVSLRLQPESRLFLLATAACFLLWRLYALTWPFWRWAEGAIDIALLLEKRQAFGGVLVAGLQFEQSRSSAWGSTQLAEQVAQEAAACENEFDYKAIIPIAEFRRQAFRVACVLACVVMIAILFPSHSRAFAARLLLKKRDYPTRTQIVEILINDQPLLDSQSARVVEGTPLSIAARVSGILPTTGTVVIESVTSEDATSLVITRVGVATDNGWATYRASGPKLKEDATFTARLGDARSDPIRLAVVHRPIVGVTIEATPPEYAQGTLAPEATQERYVNFLRGSAISFRLRCTNGKLLQSAMLEWANESASGTVSFSPPDAGALLWQLPSYAAPFQRLTEALKFATNVVDEDGLSMLQPIEGRIEVRPDQSPIGSLRTEHHLVVPTAQPVMRYEASDDFGISRLVIEVSRERSGDVSFAKTVELLTTETGGTTVDAKVAGEVPVDLTDIDLRNGDRVLVRLVATDERGEWPSASFTSEAAQIEIGDEARVLKAILEADATAERLLSDAIKEESVVKDDG